MDVADRITARCDEWNTRCVVVERTLGFADLPAAFGLTADPRIYDPLDPATARRVAVAALKDNHGCGGTDMNLAEAGGLADEFLALFAGAAPRYFTNGTVLLGRGGWSPATGATFDSGLLVLADGRAGCLWQENDE